MHENGPYSRKRLYDYLGYFVLGAIGFVFWVGIGVIVSEVVKLVSSHWGAIAKGVVFAGIAVLAVVVSVYTGRWLCEKILRL